MDRWVRRLNAWFTLGFAMLASFLRAPVPRPGEDRVWLGALRKEALTPTPAAAWEQAADSSRCIGCGLCAQAANIYAARRPQDAALVDADALAAANLAGICPTSMSTTALAARVRSFLELLA
jgi:ferredoxin